MSREDWQRYEHVFYLSEKAGHGRRDGFGGPPGFGPPGLGPDGGAPEDAVAVHEGPLFTLARADAAPEDQPTDAEVAQERLKRK
ncbi:hypothetical protein [Oleiharenicola sp. Vm1]|uniref:hypothetical protein n=1 Tax=Oleiharenicola sp. Vm1 TaxID=3398393 RepID=UPI0039F59530